VTRWFCALVIGGVLSGFAFLLVTGKYDNDGPVLLRITRGHGLHAGDFFVIAAWVLAMLALVLLTATRQVPETATMPEQSRS
jgi:hypothetical protein